MAIIFSELSTPSPYSLNEETLLNGTLIDVAFNPTINYIEYVITDNNNSFKIVDEQYNKYSFPTDGTITSNFISSIDLDPVSDIKNKNLNVGNYITHYNFFQNEANTTQYNRSLFIKEISADRTEVVIGFLYLFTSLQSVVDSLKVNNSSYFKEFYLNFGNGDICLANNIQVSSNNTLTINLYDPLPSNINVNAAFWIVTKIANTLSFTISITPDPYIPTVVPSNIKGPNFNLPIKDQTNNSTGYIDYNTLLQSQSVSSSNQIKSLLSSSGININIDYTDFNNFIHFSSAYQRLDNFYYKVSQIEDLTNQINNWSSVTNSSSSINNLQSRITSIITNFDEYDYYLYYNSGSWAWPKSNSTLPYTLYSTGSVQVINWLGNGENLTGILGSASLYDEKNQDSLYYSIPSYIRDDERNAPYYLFIEMMGQHYDSIWTYYKDVTNLHQADNRLDYGISKDLVAEALKSFGIKIYQNNFTSNDLYSALLGYTTNSPEITGSLPVTTGSFQEYINNYITASYDASVLPLDDYNKEIYKRIYHNLPYLSKTKGTIPGLRALINCFGVPDTILRISEFGGRDKDTSTYDYFDQQYNYAAVASASSVISTPWFLSSAWSSSINNFKASSVQFRFKTSDFDTGSNYQIWGISTGAPGTYPSSSLVLKYSGSGLTTGSYSGSTVNPYYQHAYLTFYPKTSDTTNTASIYLPFFDHGWWTVMVNKFEDTYTLYAGNKLYYDGYDGNQIGYLASSSITLANTLWTGSQTSTFLSSSVSIGGTTYNRFTGSFQEIRYWIKTGSVDSFKDFVMNPQSIDYSGEILYDDYLAFRLPLGGDLYTGSQSVHPRTTGSWAITSSFISSNNATLTNVSFTPNIETRFLNSPIIGLRGRVTDKIQIVNSIYPTGSVLSQYIPIAQNFPISSSESPDVNLLEVAFSPQNEINDDIINSLGYFNIGEYIGDPRQVSSSATSYPDLNTLSNNFFQKYFDTYDLTDYIRLIKYFDNSLFKMIKDFVPARTSLTSGVVIKQHILERNKYPQPQMSWEDLDYSGSIQTAFISGSTGGTFNQYNTTTFAQDWVQNYTSSVGISYISHSSQDEFYNGELPGTEFVVTDGELNDANNFKYPSTTQNLYTPTLYVSNITPLEDFLNTNTSPNQGEIYLWYDTGSILTPIGPGVPTGGGGNIG